MSKLLSENCIVFDTNVAEKQDVLMVLTKESHAAGKITDMNEFFENVLAREAIAPVYVGFDMGLPHGKTDHVLEASMCLRRMRNSVAGMEDGGTVDLVVMIAVPPSEAGNIYMRILASLSRKPMHEEFRESLENNNREQVLTISAEALGG